MDNAGETPKPEGATINEVVLKPGQNFYDQAPFRGLIATLCASTGSDAAQVRGVLTRLAKLGTDFTPGVKGEQMTAEQLAEKVADPYDLRIRYLFRSLGVSKDHALNGGIRALVGDLSKYPHWHEYVSEQLVPKLYLTDGTFLDSSGKQLPAETYRRYLLTKGKGLAKGLEVVFPQAFSGRSTYILRPVKARNIHRGKA